MKKPISIAIDGPVGSGKGTLAIALAKKLNALYVYTGAMYRELALACMRKKIDLRKEELVLHVLHEVSIKLQPSKDGIRAFLNGEDVSDEIFLPEVSKTVPIVAAFPKIREEMVVRQRKVALNALTLEKSVVMEGRDIATKVIPDADIKIYLTADIKVRAKRRLDQFKERGIKMSFEQSFTDAKERDRQDTQRDASPLTVAKDAIVVDTTEDTIDQTVQKVIDQLRKRKLA